ncbi:MAG: hypothetical protein ACJA0Z_003277 [Halioglobus sp.]
MLKKLSSDLRDLQGFSALSRSDLAGIVLLAMILASALFSEKSVIPLSGAYPFSGIAALTAGILLFPNLRISARIQVGLLFGIGTLLLIIAYSRGVSFSIIDAISRNALLLTMIMSVGFLKLLLDLEATQTRLPRGKKAHLQTLLGLGLFGSVINISAPILICDRLAIEKPIDLLTLRPISQVFCACSCWSPYFGGTALVLTYVHGVSIIYIMMTGLPLLLLTILCAHAFSVFKNSEHIEQFAGYPVTLSKLWLPISLTVAVVSMQALLPAMPILVVISLSALLLSACVLWMRLGTKEASRTLYGHVLKGLPRSSNELLLFLSAGVLATGLSAFLESTDFELALTAYTLQAACVTLAIMIMTAAAGIHPVIQISVLTPLLLPIDPGPELLAMTFLFAWALGNAASPLSGTHLMLQGRYNIPAWKLAVQNWPYVVPMYFVAIALLALQTAFKQAL